MKLHERIPDRSFGPKATATIHSVNASILLRVPATCPLLRADLILDEETFDIHVSIHEEGKLKCFTGAKDSRHKSKYICLVGFLKANDLSYEEMKGVYTVEWVEKPNKFIVVKMTRRKELIISKDDKRKICVLLSAKEKETWDRVRRNTPMSTFVRSAVNRYLEDEYLI